MKLKRRKAYNTPIAWSEKDERSLLGYLKREAFSAEKLKRLFPQRTLPSIRSKVRKLRIKHDLFGAGYRENKENFTTIIANKIKPKIVFDAYAGAGHQTFKWIEVADIVFASEIMKSKSAQFEKSAKDNGFQKKNYQNKKWKLYSKGEKKVYFFSGDALDAAVDIKVGYNKVDVLDLDTCGSTLPILPTFLILLKPKHLLITHGEFHSMRFKREDVLRRLFMHRDIRENPLPISVDEMSDELDKAVKIAALRAHNETTDSFWLNLKKEVWLGEKFHGMLRRYYKVEKPKATADCINKLSL